MALDAGAIVRTASAALFLALGLAVVIVGRKDRGALALGVFLGLFGLVILDRNVSLLLGYARDASVPVIFAKALLSAAGGASAVIVALLMPRPLARGARKAIVYGLAVGVATTAATFGVGPAALDWFALTGGGPPVVAFFARASAAIFAVGGATLAATVAARVAFDPPTDRAAWVRAAALALSTGIWVGAWAATMNHDPFSGWSLLATGLLALAVAIPWLVAAARTGSRLALGMALVWPALGFVAYAYLLIPGNVSAFTFDAYGFLGVLRLVGWAVVVYAILRADLLGVRLPHFAVSKGPVAAAALATLFIVAQIAQNFFSAEFGLLTGGIVAGAFLFMANPLQRAAERIATARSGPGPGATGTIVAPHGNDEAFRAAVRLALRDRRFSHAEELALADLAERLGIGARRATEIRHEIERDTGLT